MTYSGFTPGFADKLLDDYMEGRDLAQSIPGTSRVEAEHFAAQMVAVAALYALPLDEVEDLAEPGAPLRSDLIALSIVERLRERARAHARGRPALLDRAERLLLQVAQSPVATTGLWYEDLYLDLGWSFSERGEHARAIDMARRGLAHSIAFDEGRNALRHLRDLARHTFLARPDEGARLWAKIVAHAPADVWTYVQLGHLGADVGLADLARRARPWDRGGPWERRRGRPLGARAARARGLGEGRSAPGRHLARRPRRAAARARRTGRAGQARRRPRRCAARARAGAGPRGRAGQAAPDRGRPPASREGPRGAPRLATTR